MSKLYPHKPVLLVDDEKPVLESLEIILNMDGVTNVITCGESRAVESLLEETPVSLVVTDILMPGMTGTELLGRLHELHPEVPVIMVTGVNEVRTAVECMKNGAVDYIVKPVEKNEFTTSVRQAIELMETRQEVESLKQIIFDEPDEVPEAYKHIVGQSSGLNSVLQYLHAIRHSRKPVLITGETGVGKDIVAKAFHEDCQETGRFVTVNVGGLDDNMFSDTLFGHKKGAFTGADTNRKGMIREAENGTLFLDEIGDLTATNQVKLLTLLQSGEYLPLGEEMQRISDARIVCATNVDIDEAMKAGSFRKDLYYRLKTHHVRIPPLRERKEDIPLLVEHFLQKSADSLNKQKPTAPRELFTLLKNYQFPGNVRELESIVYEAVSVHSKGVLSLDVFRGRLSPEHSELETGEISATPSGGGLYIDTGASFPSLEEIEKTAILEAMERADGNQSMAAQLLGVSRHTIMRKLKQYGE